MIYKFSRTLLEDIAQEHLKHAGVLVLFSIGVELVHCLFWWGVAMVFDGQASVG